jgi:hypothetical protein
MALMIQQDFEASGLHGWNSLDPACVTRDLQAKESDAIEIWFEKKYMKCLEKRSPNLFERRWFMDTELNKPSKSSGDRHNYFRIYYE